MFVFCFNIGSFDKSIRGLEVIVLYVVNGRTVEVHTKLK